MSKPKQVVNFESHKRACKKYEKTINGYLMRTYRNMKSRTLGVLKKKAHLYKGLEILDKEEFYAWAKRDTAFNELHAVWTVSGHSAALAPSIDRIDPTKGYVLGNIRWLTHSQNSKLGADSRWQNQSQF